MSKRRFPFAIATAYVIGQNRSGWLGTQVCLPFCSHLANVVILIVATVTRSLVSTVGGLETDKRSK